MQVDLTNKISRDDGVNFLHVDWRAPDSRLGILYCTFAGSGDKIGLRIDFDKRAVFDLIQNETAARVIHDQLPEICRIVAVERARVHTAHRI